ncbi:MAG: DnaJ C-terminal domain-containing protein [Alteromonas sp.]|jgi:curved DNA-binding protein|uniref:DnaJ C-terminal domain-containing protein n=1 Tax=Alteromonas sp. TaxID=232 RepID=UPI0032D922B0
MEYKDYYKVMGVARDATQQEIKLAYRKLGRKYHPDVSKEPDADAQFKIIGEAYEVLKDPEKRAAYDQLGREWKNGQDFRPPPNWDSGFEFRGDGYTASDAGAYSDFFEELFGREFGRSSGPSSRRSSRMRGEDHHAKVLIAIEDSFNGAMRPVSLRMPTLTDDGHVTTRDRTLNIRIPKGIRAGQQIRLARQGGPGLGGAEPGDLYLEVAFNAHPLYRIDGGDIYLDLPVAPWEAALGAKIAVPVPSGNIELTIPTNSRQGQKLRLKGRGLVGKQAGDLYVVLQITLPLADSEMARELYKQMETKLGFNPRATMGRT